MASSSRSRRTRRSTTPPWINSLPIPDPRTWPAAEKERFCELTGTSDPLDVFFFNFGQESALFLHDAVTAAALLDVDPDGWHIEQGFPVYRFPSQQIEEYAQRLAAYGYTPKMIRMGSIPAKIRPRAEVIDIGSFKQGQDNR